MFRSNILLLAAAHVLVPPAFAQETAVGEDKLLDDETTPIMVETCDDVKDGVIYIGCLQQRNRGNLPGEIPQLPAEPGTVPVRITPDEISKKILIWDPSDSEPLK